MTVLIIDTSTERGLVALGNEQGSILAEKRLPPGYQNSDHLFPSIQALDFTPAELKMIVCATGPGSYTGIRVGAVVAKTFSYVHQIPLIGVCTLDGFAQPALIDAKSGGAYVLIEGMWKRVPLATALEVVGSGKVYTPSALQLRVKAPGVDWEEAYPSAEKLLRLGLVRRQEATTDGKLDIAY